MTLLVAALSSGFALAEPPSEDSEPLSCEEQGAACQANCALSFESCTASEGDGAVLCETGLMTCKTACRGQEDRACGRSGAPDAVYMPDAPADPLVVD